MRRDVRRFNLWTTAEIRWLWSLGRERRPKPDKLYPGEKLNALFIVGAIVVMFATGFVLKWFGFFPLRGGPAPPSSMTCWPWACSSWFSATSPLP